MRVIHTMKFASKGSHSMDEQDQSPVERVAPTPRPPGEPSDLTFHVIKRMRELRTQRGISALELERKMASEAGLVFTRAVIANLENNRRRDISVDQLVGLAKVFQTDILHLLGLGGFECMRCKGEPPEGFSCLACGLAG